MIRKLLLDLRLLWERFVAHERRMTARRDQLAKVETFGAMVVMVAMIATAWAFAWYAHIIGPWLDGVMGWGPHDIDSPGKIRWRRMWSTAICLPGIVLAILNYILNVRDRMRARRGREDSEQNAEQNQQNGSA
jgi:TRAP-type C4-dicarboxylate transport system permease small subunit